MATFQFIIELYLIYTLVFFFMELARTSREIVTLRISIFFFWLYGNPLLAQQLREKYVPCIYILLQISHECYVTERPIAYLI